MPPSGAKQMCISGEQSEKTVKTLLEGLFPECLDGNTISYHGHCLRCFLHRLQSQELKVCISAHQKFSCWT